MDLSPLGHALLILTAGPALIAYAYIWQTGAHSGKSKRTEGPGVKSPRHATTARRGA